MSALIQYQVPSEGRFQLNGEHDNPASDMGPSELFLQCPYWAAGRRSSPSGRRSKDHFLVFVGLYELLASLWPLIVLEAGDETKAMSQPRQGHERAFLGELGRRAARRRCGDADAAAAGEKA